MLYRLDTHVLTVDAKVIHKVDTANPQNLFNMWTVFSKCAESVEQGRRLENLSWRLWQQKQLCQESCDKPVAPTPEALPLDIPSDQRISDHRIPDVPQLSGSVESAIDDDTVEEFTSVSAPLDITRPIIRRQDSTSSRSRGRDRNITSDDFEKMIVDIIKAKSTLSAPLPLPPFSTPPVSPRQSVIAEHIAVQRPVEAPTEAQARAEAPAPAPQAAPTSSNITTPKPTMEPIATPLPHHRREVDFSVLPRPPPHVTTRTAIVKGFSPCQSPNLRSTPRENRMVPADAIPAPKASPAPKAVQPKKQPARFTLGDSCSSGEPADTIEDAAKLKPSRNPMFQVGASSDEDSLKSALRSHPSGLLSRHKMQAPLTTSQVSSAARSVLSEAAIDDESDSEGDLVDESAIEDDDESSEWEDSIEESGESGIEAERPMFQRVDSSAHLPTRRSLLTLGLRSQSTSALNMRARTSPSRPMATSPNDSDEGSTLMMKRPGRSMLNPITEGSRPGARPVMAVTSQVQPIAALSPRTTRRHMLATELTESLRRHLLWERKQKTSTANAVMKRRHTSHDVANLKQFPETPYMKKEEDANVSSWNQCFHNDLFNGYHAKGW